jgi:radical SAM protein with 4Fe4S-binding SPASM domain
MTLFFVPELFYDSSVRLPADATPLPIFGDDRLLVSPDLATFCPVPGGEVGRLEAVLAGEAALGSLSPGLLASLERHGFFGEPRPPEPDKPSIQLQLTNSCNLACTYCCTNSGQPRQTEVSLQQASRVVDQAAEVLGSEGQMALLGGEPFLVPWAIDVAERIVDRGHHLTIFSNGTLHHTDEQLARRTAELNRRGAEVRISLAGPTRELCDGASGTSRFEAALGGIESITRFGGSVVVDLMVLPEQVEAVARGFHGLRKQLPPGTPIALGILYLSGRETGQHMFRTRGDLEAALDRIAFEGGELISAPQTAPVTHRREGCGCAMGNHLHVRSDGRLFTCFKMEERVGDLATDDFVETARRMRESPHPARSLEYCADCALATLCGGGCRSDNLLYTGDADEPACGPWRVRVLSELLAEERVTAVDWPVHHLLAEARRRGIDAPERLDPVRASRHLTET